MLATGYAPGVRAQPTEPWFEQTHNDLLSSGSNEVQYTEKEPSLF